MSDARAQAWNATQWLARLAHSYAPQPVLTLRWDAAAARIVTPDLVPGTAVGLTLATLVLQFEEDGRPVPHPLALDEKSSSEVEAWILVELLHRDIDRERFSKALPYETGALMSGEQPKYMAQDLAAELGGLSAALADAADTFARAAAQLELDPSLVVWPQTMELGFCVPARDGDPSRGAIRVAYLGGDGDEASSCVRVAREGGRASRLPPQASVDDIAARVAAVARL